MPAWFEVGSTSLELLKVMPTAIVAAVAAYVAWKQWELAKEQHKATRAKLNLELFEERYALYELLWSYLSMRVHNLDQVSEISLKLGNAAPKFRFLFGAEIAEFVSEARSRGIEQDVAHNTMRQLYGQDEQMEKAKRTLTEQYTWFFEGANGLRDRFAKYMDFAEWSST